MDPYNEERLRNEVIYLHSLWHQGPPNPRPTTPFVPSNPRRLQFVNSSTFENKKRKERKPIRRGRKKRTQVDAHLNLGPEWPMPTQDSAPVASGWPPLEPRPAQATPPLSAEEKEKLQALQVQYKARQACREFLFDYDDSDDDDDVEDDEDNVDNDDGDDEAEEIAEFFSKLFGENNELRNYYEKCWESGEFRCLVCAVADNKNAGKRFHDCVGLVQHSMSISRTKNKRAHRAFGNAVCNVLGWDIHRLPTIVMKNEVKPTKAEGKTNDNAADGKDGFLPSDKLDYEASVEQVGEPVKQDVEVVHETIKGISELLASTQDSVPVASGWPPLEARPTQATPPLSKEEKEKLQALQVQYKARQACREFLFDYDDSDDADDVEDGEGNVDDEDEDEDEDDGAEEIGEFFSKLFGENNDLRNYYEKCWESGEFRCLVCAVADNKNAGKRFHDCVGLVQHSMSISRTKNIRAHRAFRNAVCDVLGWDIQRLPTIVMKKEVKPAGAEGKTNDDDADGKDGSLSSDKLDDEVSMEQLGEPVKQDEVVHETIKRVSEGKTNENDVDVKDGSLSSDKLDYKVSLEQLGEPIRQGVEVVHETVKQGELDKSARSK